MMPIIDDFTRRVVVYFMREKSEASDLFKQFQAKSEKEGYLVKAVRFDNGGEFSSIELTNYLK